MFTYILIYWVVCGLILFSLTQPTVTALNIPNNVLWELFSCLVVGGIFIPILGIGGVIYFIKMLFERD